MYRPQLEEFEESILPATKDSIMFTLNTISNQNLSSKTQELYEILMRTPETNLSWFANYLVFKRASTEPNFHNLYIAMLKEMNSQCTYKAVVSETFRFIDLLISTSLDLSEEERKTLNALGAWIGKLTLGNNKPILIRSLDLKAKLREAYELKKLLPIVPFVCKILKACKKALVFNKKNIWVLGVAALLHEVKERTDKARISSEIEILFKKLNLLPEECPPSNVLESERRPVPETVPKPLRTESFNLCEQTMMTSLPGMVNISPKLIDLYPEAELRNIVAVAIESAIKEIIQPIVQRNVNIALITTKELVLKDFEYEKDPAKLQQASHWVVQSLAGSLAKVTSREPFRVHAYNFLSDLLRKKSLSSASIKGIAEDASRDNLDLGCDLIAKIVIKKALNDVMHEESIKLEISKRQEPQSFLSGISYKLRNTNMHLPEILKPKPSGLTAEQFAVYHSFDRLQAENKKEAPPKPESILNRIAVSKFEEQIETAENLFVAKGQLENPEVQHAIENVIRFAVHTSSRPENLAACTKIIFNKLYTNTALLKFYLQILQTIKTQNSGLITEATNYLLMVKDSQKFHWEITSELIRGDIINLADFDTNLSRGIDHYYSIALEFAMRLLRDFVINNPIVPAKELPETINSIKKLRERKPSEELISLCSALVPSHKESMVISHEKGKMLEAIELKFNEWLALTVGQPQIDIQKIPDYVKNLEPLGFLNCDEQTQFFFTTLAEIAISRSRFTNGEVDYSPIDCFSKLSQVIIVLSSPKDKVRMIKMLKIVLNSVKGLILNEIDSPQFNQRPYYCILQDLLTESTQPTLMQYDVASVYESLIPIAEVFHELNPCKAPAFCFAWLELISHRYFLPKMVRSVGDRNAPSTHWKNLHRLIVDLFRFVNLHYWNTPLPDSLKKFYQGVLRLVLVLINDCPEFVCGFYLDFCELIPESCLQLRNLVLSAYPKGMQVPLPHTPNLKVDLLKEMGESPVILSNYIEKLNFADIKRDVENYFDLRDVKYIKEICNKLLISEFDSYEHVFTVNTRIMNALVVYISNGVNSGTIDLPFSNQFFVSFSMLLGAEQQFQLVNAIANQLRFPNSDTQFASCLMLYLFTECNHNSLLEEMIAKVLTERATTYRPHPWGVLITLIELVKNLKYEFLKKPFTKYTPDIENLYLKLSKNCIPDIEESKA